MVAKETENVLKEKKIVRVNSNTKIKGCTHTKRQSTYHHRGMDPKLEKAYVVVIVELVP